MSARPSISVVAVTCDTYETVALSLAYVRAQDVAGQVEVVFVAPSLELAQVPEDAGRGFHSFLQVESGPLPNRGTGTAAGVRAATASVVGFLEDHSFMQPGMLAAILERFGQGTYGAVSPMIRNANPDSLISWADLVTGYGQLLGRNAAGEGKALAGHNCAYDRQVLLDVAGERLPTVLDAELLIAEEMKARGLGTYLEQKAQVMHLNFERLSSWVVAQVAHGRVHFALRAHKLTLLQRLLHVLRAPLVPLVRTRRMLQLQIEVPHPRWKLAVGLFVGQCASVVGEVLGSIAGAGGAARLLLKYEFHRHQHLVVRRPLAQVIPSPAL